MAKNLFSIPIFFIVFRETLEAAIIVSVLLGLAEQIVNRDPNFIESIEEPRTSGEEDVSNNEPIVDDAVQRRRLLRKMRIQVKTTMMLFNASTTVYLRVSSIQIFFGAGLGFFIALAVGAA